MLGKKVAIDVGSSVVRVAVKHEPGVIAEPCGELGADAAALDHVLHQLITRVTGRQRIFKPDLMVAVPSNLPGDQRRLLLEGCMRAGARTAFLLDSILAAAIGTGQSIEGPHARLVIDAGAGRVELCVIAMEGSVARRIVPGSAQLDRAISAAVAQRCETTLDAATAERVKRELASATPAHEERTLLVSGHSTRDRTVQPCTVSDRDIDDAVRGWVQQLDVALTELLEETPRQLRAGLTEGRLTGAGAWLRGLDRHLSQVAGLVVQVAAEPDQCTLRGCLAALDNLDLLKRNLLYIR